MKLADFRAKHTEITVDILWSVIPSDVPIEEIMISSSEELEGLHAAWYYPQVDTVKDYLDPTKRNLKVSEVAANLDLVSSNKRRRIEGMVHAGLAAGCLPVYRLSDDTYFLLDGNHRAVAACIGAKLPLTLHVINGPISKSILADLWRWELP